MQTVTGQTSGSITLLKSGYRSANALARSQPEEISKKTGMPLDEARAYHAQAEHKAGEASLAWFAFFGSERDSRTFTSLPLPEIPPSLKKIAGYAELFGSLDFCHCEKCQSVLGAGAYFVDLMFFVEQYILTKSFADHGEEQNGLHLRRRRPDLWSLPLTCDNTNRVVPSLTLVIDILEQFLLRAEGVPTVAQLYNERLETADHSIRLPFSLPLERLSVWLGHLGIRRSEIAHAFLRRDQDPQMVRARIRLGMIPEQFRLITTSRLGDSSQENVDVASEFFSRWLGITVRLSPSTLAETEVLTLTNVLVFTRASGLNRAVVNTILSTDFVNGDAGRGVDPIEVKSGIATDGNVQNDSEWVKNLTGGRLDRFERFVRLWRHVPWTVEELDYVLDRMRKRGVAMESGRFTEDQAAVLGLAQLLDIQEQFQLPVDVLCALWDELPQVVLQGERSLFDRLFNAEPWAGVNQKWDNPRLRIETSPDAQARLCAGLQVDSVELGVLLRGLDACLQRVDGIPPDPPTIVSPLDKNLSLLYRHARLARLRKLSVEELMQTLALVPSIQARSENKRCVLELQDLRELLETHDWRVASGFTLKEIAFITQTGQTLPGYENAIDLATRIVQEIRTESLLHLSSEVFTQLGLSQADSDRIVRENSTPEDGGQPLLEPVPGESTFRISRGIAVDDVSTELKFNETPNAVRIAEVARDLYRIIKGAGENGFQATDLAQLGLSEKQADALIKANVFVPGNDDKPFEQAPLDGVRYRLRKTVTEAEAIARFGRDQEDQVAVARILKRRAVDLLIRYHADAVLAAKASIAAKVSPEKARALLNLVKPRDAMRTSLVDTLQGGPIEVLTNTLHRLLQCALLFRGQIFDAQTLEFVRQNQSAFAFAEPFTSESVRRTSLYQKLATGSDPAYQPDALTIDLPALQAVVAQRGSIKKDPRVQSQLGRALRTDEVLVKEVLAKIEPAAGASRLDELSQLREALDLTRRLGIPAEIVRFAVSEDPDELTRGADGVFAAIRGKYPDEKKFIEAIEPFEDKLRSRNRDGLVGYLLHAPSMRRNGQQRFASPNDLYHYFLTDVMVEGCARTSRVVAAISSLQLYVHRVLMNLEESDADDPTVPVVTVRLDEDKKAEWRWRKNYQVWVANRKVFLYPENYIEPGLRDQKTPLFKELEDTLLQQQITEQNVLDAYATYLRGFEEVARLSIAGAYRDRTGRDDLLHLFGVTPSDPPVYYYRTVRNLDNANGPVVSAWEKVDAQIPVRKVSPIVYLNRLCLFWVETTTRPLNEFKDGDSVFLGYRHSVRSKFSQLRLDGRWTPSQTLRFLDTTGVVSESKTIDETVEMTLMHTRVRSFIAIFTPGVPGYTVPNPLPAYLYGPLQLGPTEPLKDFEVVRGRVQWDRLGRNHAKPIEGYSPQGWQWDRVYPQVKGEDGTDLELFFFPRTPLPSNNYEFLNRNSNVVDLWSLTASPSLGAISAYATDTKYIQDLMDIPEDFDPGIPAWRSLVLSKDQWQLVNGDLRSVILQSHGYVLLVQHISVDSRSYRLWPASTSIAEQLGKKLMVLGINGMLDLNWQLRLDERTPSFIGQNADVFDYTPFTNSQVPYAPFNWYSLYFREVFFHIPFLIADHLNSQGKFADAQRWYHYLYDPTANESDVDKKLRPWRYREFREDRIPSMRVALTDTNALDAYAADPFNPHAIARLRPGAYQKAIIMKYIDNLLDWGDNLFTQFTMESVSEATMLYVMAADILGPRPTELGPCGETSATGKTYNDIAPSLRDSQGKADVLIEELESFSIVSENVFVPALLFNFQGGIQYTRQAAMATGSDGAAPEFDAARDFNGAADPAGWNRVGGRIWKERAGTSVAELHTSAVLGDVPKNAVGGQASPELRVQPDPVGPDDDGTMPPTSDFTKGRIDLREAFVETDYLPHTRRGSSNARSSYINSATRAQQGNTPIDLVRSRLVFCIPENPELKAYWNRVEDRLYKIRNCMDIAGVRRRLELFAPEIDPRFLVRMRAAGLTLDDVLNVTSGNLPPYRFVYLIEKAKQHAGLVQSFGNQLLSALEKRDAEELTRLRTVHEQNLLKLRSEQMRSEIDAANDTLESLQRQKISAEYRRDHFIGLVDTGLSAPERVQQISTHASSSIHATEATLAFLGGGLHLIPNLGAPTAMKYGGKELGDSMRAFAIGTDALAAVAQAIATSAGIEATFQRRDQEWRHQVELAKKELDQLAKQITAAEIRRDIAVESQKVHERSIEQVQEIFDFLRDRFTNLGRFTWLSAELQKLHRQAFNAALSMARLAEQACHFEHPDATVQPSLSGGYWDAGNAGLLAGDRLLLDLQNLERQYIEINHRTLEIEQAFSLARFAPDALSRLKLEGDCTFDIPEWFFDLSYPGHYRRRIKVVRLTIPCIVGPYTNVGATLRLTASHIRKEPQIDSRVSVPLRHVTAIAASSGQSDAGVFEFSFRDERYMPFEGAGVDTSWNLSLPKEARSFDYATISDVILRISYTAVEDTKLKETVEGGNGILKILGDTGILRTFSLRSDFPDAWHTLLGGSTEVEIDIRDVHVPFFLSGFELATAPFDFLIQLPPDATYPTISFDNAAITGPGADAKSGLYKHGSSNPVAVVAKHTIKLTGVDGAPARLDSSKVKDIVLRVVLKR